MSQASATTETETTMTTETTTPAQRAKRISDRLLEIGPYPASSEEATAGGMARYLAVRAAVINHQLLSPDSPFSRRQVDLLTVLFGAAHALRTFAAVSEAEADRAAKEILNAWEDGGGIGEWLWDHLGSEACAEIGPLADELARLAKPADGLLAHADPIRHALNRAMLDAKSANHRDAYMKALHALEESAAETEEAAVMTTEANTTPAPGNISPGRAACEAFWAAVGAGPSIQEPGAAWGWAISQKATGAWEAAAEAAKRAAGVKGDPMFEQAYMDVQKALDKALGTEEEDGTGGGIASEVWLLAHQRDEARAERDRLRNGGRELGRITARLYRSMRAAAIEMAQNGPHAGMQWILNSIPPPVDEGDGELWNGTETAQEWFDRVEAADRAAEAEATP